jgi:outer membrane protein TolC
VAAALRELELKRTDLVVSVVELHEELVKLQRRLDYERQSLARLERFVHLTEARERQGRATRVDTLRAELRRGNAHVRLGATGERLQALQSEYADVLGLAPDAAIRAVPGPRLALDVADGSAALAAALSNRLDYAQILQDRRDASRGVRLARRNLWPDLSVLADSAWVGEGADAGDAGRLDEHVWFVGLAAGTEFPRTQERLALQEAALSEQVLEIRIEALRAALARQVQQARLAYQRAEAELPLEARNFQAAWARVRLARRLYDIGRGDSFSVSEAEDEYQSAEERWLAAEASVRVAAYRLMRVTGTLLEYPEELKPGAIP